MNILGKALHIFKSPSTQWSDIRKTVNGKSGVYVLYNNLNGEYYIGSEVNLYQRLRDYYQPWYQQTNSTLVVVRAMKKYGIENFSILIVEMTTREQAVPAEQRWLDQWKPVYNTLTEAASTLGYKHTQEGLIKISEAMKGKARSDEVKASMSARQTGKGNNFFGRTHTDHAKALLSAAQKARSPESFNGFAVEVLDTLTNTTKSYRSIRAVTREFNCSIATVTKYKNLLYKGRYIISMAPRPSGTK